MAGQLLAPFPALQLALDGDDGRRAHAALARAGVAARPLVEGVGHVADPQVGHGPIPTHPAHETHGRYMTVRENGRLSNYGAVIQAKAATIQRNRSLRTA